MNALTLPPVESWWPYLTIGARNQVLRNPRGALDSRVRGEIGRATGSEVPKDARLTEDDVRFVHAQTDEV